MINPQQFLKICSELRLDYFVGVPDSLLKNLINQFQNSEFGQTFEVSVCEGSAVALASAQYYATGRPSIVFMQNSGLGNAINPLTSLAAGSVYGVPMILIIGWRGRPGIKDEPQHVEMGNATQGLLHAMGIKTFELSAHVANSSDKILREAYQVAIDSSQPVALLVHENTFSKATTHISSQSPATQGVSRIKALEMIANSFQEAAIIGTTGHTSRELLFTKSLMNLPNENDFLMVGSMGYASQFAAKIAQLKPNKQVICLDGDGAFLMHLGGIKTIGEYACENFLHIVFNNNCHLSVGNSETGLTSINMQKLAESAGYSRAVRNIDMIESLEAELKEFQSHPKLTMLEVRTLPDVAEDLPRPATSPKESGKLFMEFIND